MASQDAYEPLTIASYKDPLSSTDTIRRVSQRRGHTHGFCVLRTDSPSAYRTPTAVAAPVSKDAISEPSGPFLPTCIAFNDAVIDKEGWVIYHALMSNLSRDKGLGPDSCAGVMIALRRVATYALREFSGQSRCHIA